MYLIPHPKNIVRWSWTKDSPNEPRALTDAVIQNEEHTEKILPIHLPGLKEMWEMTNTFKQRNQAYTIAHILDNAISKGYLSPAHHELLKMPFMPP